MAGRLDHDIAAAMGCRAYTQYIKNVLHLTVKPVCNDHLYNKMYNLWFIQ